MGIDWEEHVRCRRRRYGSVLTRRVYRKRILKQHGPVVENPLFKDQGMTVVGAYIYSITMDNFDQ